MITQIVCSINNETRKQSCDFIDMAFCVMVSVITSANKLCDFQCKFANVRMAMKDNEQNRIDI